MVTKEQLTNAIADFILEDIAKDIRDASVKAMAVAVAKMLKKNPDVIDKALSNSIVSALLDECNGEYDISVAKEVIEEVIQEQGKICLLIPSIPLIHPTETVIGMTQSDIEKLFYKLEK